MCHPQRCAEDSGRNIVSGCPVMLVLSGRIDAEWIDAQNSLDVWKRSSVDWRKHQMMICVSFGAYFLNIIIALARRERCRLCDRARRESFASETLSYCFLLL